MAFSPVLASKNIVEKYKRYLSTIFEINHPVYSKQFEKELSRHDMFIKGPYLDVTDSFQKGRSIRQLIQAGELPKGFEKINMPLDRPLYLHQEEAIMKASRGKNIVVSTGTGSGKTESFLIPILRELISEHEKGCLTPGVRALIIYPMNALANDQVERLRELLSNYPEITYGSYTGQTKHHYEKALNEYKSLNNNESPLPNELISRDQMKERPPHILITNYAMLEYLLVRPDDHVFFDGPYSKFWKFVVLDEAHVYSGSTGIEVSMLLRRLMAKLEKEKLQYILTSATLGEEKDNEDVVSFANNLSNQPFHTQDIVRARRIRLNPEGSLITVPITFYREMAELINHEAATGEILLKIDEYSQQPVDRSLAVEEALYHFLLQDQNYWFIRSHLQKPKTVASLAASMSWSLQDVEDFVTVASRCEMNGDRLFDARYHMFLRATESVFITLQPNNRVFLNRKKTHIEDGKVYHVFEIATCSSCHDIYLVGKIENNYLQHYDTVDDEYKQIFYLGNQVSDSDADHTLVELNVSYEAYDLCPHCGYIIRAGSTRRSCEHDRNSYIRVQHIKRGDPSKPLTKCVSCENTNSYGILRMFFTGQEAVTSVIGTALFEELPAYQVKKEVVFEEDDSGFDFSGIQEQTTRMELAKQFIAFSDSRQAAAFFSSYFDQTYRNILYKRLIVETLRNEQYGKEGKNFYEFVEDLIYQFEKYHIASESKEATRKEAWKAALQEVVDNNRNTSLFNLGFLSFTFEPETIPPNNKYNLSSEEVLTICNVFAMGMMADAAIHYEISLNSADREYFAHGGIEYSYTLSDANPRSYLRSFIPSEAKMSNKRLDYLRRIMEKSGVKLSDDQLRSLLQGFWNSLFLNNGFLHAIQGKYKIDLRKVQVRKGELWYRCSKCARVTVYNARNVCPSYKCLGTLEQIDITAVFENNHYYYMYQNLDIRELRIVEHTAQLSREMAYEYQNKFKRKEIDVLSCSTTFEMGVDVGSLETVFMRNMPPSPSNYAQRAGRAGRSKQAAAYALTFCNKSSHDFTYFKHPERMIRGNIQPPRFVVENDKIAIRHVFASAFSFFWRKYPEYFTNASDMAEGSKEKNRGVSQLQLYLAEKPEDLKDFLIRFLPDSLIRKFGVKDFKWVSLLLSSDPDAPGTLTKAVREYEYEVNQLREAIIRTQESRQNPYQLYQRLNVFEKEQILTFLSRKNVLPKYGFPVDTVEMGIFDRTNRMKLGLQLHRDLSMAISEYAPGSQIVANGNLITSRYIRKVPNMSWRQYDYIQCRECQTLNLEQHVDDDNYSKLNCCTSCGVPLDVTMRKVFLVPEFGFEADGDRITRPGLRKPKRTYRGDISYVGFQNKLNIQRYTIGNSRFELGMNQSDKMAVLNDSNFYVCEYCGYTELLDNEFKSRIRKKHDTPSGYGCQNDGTNSLKRFALGYVFETDVVHLKFLYPEITNIEYALSILYGVLRGVATYLNIEQNDIAGCAQYFYNDVTGRGNYALILYDRTPGGAGHVRRLNDQKNLEGVLLQTLNIMQDCDCGGEEGDSSCYTCLRGYYNQKYHDLLNRRVVIDFLGKVLSGVNPTSDQITAL